MPYKHMLNEIVGKLSTGITLAGAIVANLPSIESWARIGVSMAGIATTLIAGRYWWIKGSNAIHDRKHNRHNHKPK